MPIRVRMHRYYTCNHIPRNKFILVNTKSLLWDLSTKLTSNSIFLQFPLLGLYGDGLIHALYLFLSKCMS